MKEKQMCEISMTYQALEPVRRAICNETCIRQAMIDGLKKVMKNLYLYYYNFSLFQVVYGIVIPKCLRLIFYIS